MKNLSDYKRLRTFKVLYEQLNFTTAAQALYISQSTVSLQIKSLEEELGVQLFIRNGKTNITPTEQAQLFYRYVNDIIHEWDEVSDIMLQLHKESSKCIIGVSHTFSNCYLEELLDILIDKFPEVHFEICIENSKRIFDRLTRDELHFGVVEKPMYSKYLSRHELMSDQLVLAGDLDSNFWFIREKDSGIRHFTDAYLAKENIVPDHYMVIHNNAEICKQLDKGIGKSIVSKHTIARETAFKMLDESFNRMFYLLHIQKLSPLFEQIQHEIIKYSRKVKTI